MSAPAVSATLAINEAVAAKRAEGEQVLHLGFGEAGLPVHPMLVQLLAEGASKHAYPPVVGDLASRVAAAGYFDRRGIHATADTVVMAPGSKSVLHALLAVLPGDVVLPSPSWVSYAAQAAISGKQVIWAPIGPEAGGVPDPTALADSVAAARARGQQPGILVLTIPDNPTGTAASGPLVSKVCELAAELDLVVVSDEIYRDVIHPAADTGFVSPAQVISERAIVTAGLSKNLALGGWRLGFANFPDTEAGRGWRDAVAAFASEVWSAAPAPVLHAAAGALTEPAELRDHIALGARGYGAVMTALHEAVIAGGASCRPPQAGFYLYPDVERGVAALAERGLSGAAGLEHYLLQEHNVAVLGGHHFGDDPQQLRFRMAGSMLFGESEEERWAAFQAPNPAQLPQVVAAAAQLKTAIAALS